MSDLAPDPGHSEVPAEFENELRAICDHEAVSAQAFVDQDALVLFFGLNCFGFPGLFRSVWDDSSRIALI